MVRGERAAHDARRDKDAALVLLYPSIISGTGANFREFDAYVFAKADGRNTR